MRKDLSEREMAVEYNFRMATPFMHKPFLVPPAEPERLEITDVGGGKKSSFMPRIRRAAPLDVNEGYVRNRFT